MKRFINHIAIICIIAFVAICSCNVSDRNGDADTTDSKALVSAVYDLDSIVRCGTLRVVTMEGAFSYYLDKHDRENGYDYALAKNLADYLDLNLELIIAADVEEMYSYMESGEADIVAFRIAHSQANKRRFSMTNEGTHTTMVLVQRRESGRISDVTDLIGKKVYVRPNSKYKLRMKNLNEEIGGGIEIISMPDSVSVEQMIYKVSIGKIDYCVADNDLATINDNRLHNIDASLALSLPQTKGWAVRKDAPLLLAAVNEWQEEIKNTRLLRRLQNQYFKNNTYYDRYNPHIPKGSISPYDNIFKINAKTIGWDWRMLAALAWNESHFNPYAESEAGAKGIMQMMPKTASKYGLDSVTIHNPEKSIEAGVQYIKWLNMIFKRVEDSEERIKFILAGYNAGPGHVLDAMDLAEKYGENPYIWDDSVEKFLLLKNVPEFYKDPVNNSGFFNGRQTVSYVHNVYKTYEIYVKRK